MKFIITALVFLAMQRSTPPRKASVSITRSGPISTFTFQSKGDIVSRPVDLRGCLAVEFSVPLLSDKAAIMRNSGKIKGLAITEAISLTCYFERKEKQ